MLSLTAWGLFALFYAVAVTAYWRYRLTGNRAVLWMVLPFVYGALLYLFILSPLYQLIIARYAVRFAFVLLIVPWLLENVDAIINHKQNG